MARAAVGDPSVPTTIVRNIGARVPTKAVARFRAMSMIGRRRRPRWLWLLIMVTAIVLLVDLVVSTRSDAPSRRGAALGYLDQGRGQIRPANRPGARAAGVRSPAGQMERAGDTQGADPGDR